MPAGHATVVYVTLSLLVLWICGAAAAPGLLAACPDQGAVVGHCSWEVRAGASGPVRVVSASPQLQLIVANAARDSKPAPAGDFHLTLQRLIIAGVKLTAATDEDVPLWPLGMYTAVGNGLNISDVRLMVDAADLQQYLELMQRLPRAVAQYHTDGRSFLHIAAWEARKSSVHSVTLISGPCLASNPAAYAQLGRALAAAGQDGCNVRAVDNTTLVPTLVSQASLPTSQPLLVLITTNVSLGFGLKAGAIPVNRPVVMVGLYSVPTSVDLYMQVNQLNASAGKYSKVFFLALFLENAAPGDAVSSLLSRPMSSAVSANVYAVYCDRLSNCLNLHNSTVVLASQQEMDYLNYMYSMFNSPLPNMRQATAFYHTELRCVIIQMGPGPYGVGMTLHNLTCGAWDIYNSVFTTQPAVAERLPFPEGAPQITAATKAGPLVQSVKDCVSLQEAMKFRTIETRLHVWMLLNNLELVPAADPDCWQNRDIRYPTQMYGQPYDSLGSEGSQAPYMFGMGYMRDALVLPPTADNKFFSVFNTTLAQLPQGPDARTNPAPERLPPGIFTLLMWSVSRAKASVDPVYVHDVTVWLPQPEYDFLAERAAASSSFAVQLMGDGGDITFKGTTMSSGPAVRVQSFDGPGILGVNVQLRPAQQGQTPPDYWWPAAAAAGLDISSDAGLSVGQVVGIVVGSVCGVLLLLAAVAAAWLRRRRRSHKHSALLPQKPPMDTAPIGSMASSLSKTSQHSKSAAAQVDRLNAADKDAVGTEAVSVDTSTMHDLLPPLPKAAGAANGSVATSSSTRAGSLPSGAASSSAVASSSSDSISQGLDRWRAAISTTTMQLMERRMQLVQGSPSCSSTTASIRTPSGVSSRLSRPQAGAGGHQELSASGTPAPQQSTGLQIHHLIGQGSFGSVWLGSWHGKRVAVKIMQLPATGLLANQDDRHTAALMAQNQANSPPHMAIMEAVVSSAVSHPNVVQVYTYMVNPLGVGGQDGGTAAAPGAGPAVQQPPQSDTAKVAAPGRQPPSSSISRVTGWEVRLVMEYCNAGTLREALDKRLLRVDGTKYLPVDSILSLMHDVAAALLHLHNQGVIHGDLKAANCMLTQSGDNEQGVWAAAYGHKVTAKVADFGLALPLDPADTHATLAARGTPTHMSPELFMSGHVSKASDIYAFGILLHELISGQRAYSGVPIPLLPHEVAVKGLRPQWPADLPEEYSGLRALAEACWSQVPQDRPTILEIFDILGLMVQGQPALHLLPHPQQSSQQQQQQQDVAPRQNGSSPAEELQQGQRPAPLQQQQQDAVLPANQSPGGRRNMSWSEVTFVSPS